MAALSPPRFFRRLASRGLFFPLRHCDLVAHATCG